MPTTHQTKEVKKATRHDLTIIGVVLAGAFLAILNQTVMGPALPKLMDTFAISAASAQWVTTIYMLVNGIMIPVSGFLIDKYSTRKLFFGSMLAFIAGTVLCAMAPNFGFLLAGRILQAAGAGIQMPLIAVVPMLVFPPEKRGTAMGMAGIVMSVAPAAGPVVAGAIIDALGWRAMFWCIAPVALIVLIASFFLLGNIGTLKNPKLDFLSVILSTVAFGGLLYGFSSASTFGWTSPIVWGVIILGAAALAWFVMRQKKLTEPLLNIRALKSHTFAWSAILVTIVNSATAVTSVTLPIYLQNVLGIIAMETGMVMLPAAAVGILLSPISGVVFDKYGPRGISIAGLVIMVAGFGLLSQINESSSVVWVAVFCTMQATGQCLCNMPITTWGVNALENDMIAHGNAITNTGRQVGGAISTAIIVTIMSTVAASQASLGPVVSMAHGVGVAYGVSGIVAAIALIIVIVKVRNPQKGEY